MHLKLVMYAVYMWVYNYVRCSAKDISNNVCYMGPNL